MEIAKSLVLGTLGSLIAALIVLLGGAWLSKTFRRALTATASAFLGVETKFAYKDGKEAESAIKEALSSTNSVRVFTGRGNEFQRDVYTPVIEGVSCFMPRTRVLLPDPDVTGGRDWITYREQELKKVDRSFTQPGVLRKQISTNLEFLSSHVGSHFEVRMYDCPHFGRLIMTDNDLFLTPYGEGRHGRHSKVLQFGRGEIYSMFGRMFEMLWHASSGRQIEPARPRGTSSGSPASEP